MKTAHSHIFAQHSLAVGSIREYKLKFTDADGHIHLKQRRAGEQRKHIQQNAYESRKLEDEHTGPT